MWVCLAVNICSYFCEFNTMYHCIIVTFIKQTINILTFLTATPSLLLSPQPPHPSPRKGGEEAPTKKAGKGHKTENRGNPSHEGGLAKLRNWRGRGARPLRTLGVCLLLRLFYSLAQAGLEFLSPGLCLLKCRGCNQELPRQTAHLVST